MIDVKSSTLFTRITMLSIYEYNNGKFQMTHRTYISSNVGRDLIS